MFVIKFNFVFFWNFVSIVVKANKLDRECHIQNQLFIFLKKKKSTIYLSKKKKINYLWYRFSKNNQKNSLFLKWLVHVHVCCGCPITEEEVEELQYKCGDAAAHKPKEGSHLKRGSDQSKDSEAFPVERRIRRERESVIIRKVSNLE